MTPHRSTTESRTQRGAKDFISVVVADQTFGIPVGAVQDVFVPQSITRVPLAPREIAGVLNLRGRIVTAVDLRARLGLPPAERSQARLAVGIEKGTEAYGLLIDALGDVLSLAPQSLEPNPSNLDAEWSAISHGVYRLDGKLLVVLDVDRVLDFGHRHEAT
jgi:purine-binding chemotaxis protein CheW